MSILPLATASAVAPSARLLDPFSRERLERFAENPLIQRARIPLIATDGAMCIRVWNDAMEEMTKIAADAVRGYPIHVALPYVLSNGSLPALLSVLMKGEASTSSHWAAFASGVHLVYEASRRPVFSPEGRVDGIVVAFNTYRRVAPFDWLVDPKDLEIPEEDAR